MPYCARGQWAKRAWSGPVALMGGCAIDHDFRAEEGKSMVMTHRFSACACGRVRFKAVGEPIVSLACYCEDCQKGGVQIESLPGAPPFREPDGGTP